MYMISQSDMSEIVTLIVDYSCLVCLTNHHQVSKKSDRAAKSPAGLFFQHAGHRFFKT